MVHVKLKNFVHGKQTSGVKMVISCCAIGCKSRKNKNSSLSFHRFPREQSRRNKWIAALGRIKWQPNEYSYLCSAHFAGGKKSDDVDSPAYNPVLFESTPEKVRKKIIQDFTRYERAKKRRTRRRLNYNVGEKQSESIANDDSPTQQPLQPSVNSSCCEVTVTDKAVQTVGMTVHRPMKSFPSLISPDELKTNKKMVTYYTGLPSYAVLMVLYDFIAPFVSSNHGRNKLSKFHQFMIVLMKLRLNLADQDLAFRFGAHQSTISRKFKTWIYTMFVRLKPLIKWPEREVARQTMPIVFRGKFCKCICIIDCFEVFCERPSGLKARAQTYSQYKHHNTVKFLIAISPQGSISFISNGWGGRVSDQHLTENCGLLPNLLPGDLVLADRGFNISESVGLYCAELVIPPFTKGKPQLCPIEIENSREIAHVRIHVERVIGLLRQKYMFLKGELPINILTV